MSSSSYSGNFILKFLRSLDRTICCVESGLLHANLYREEYQKANHIPFARVSWVWFQKTSLHLLGKHLRYDPHTHSVHTWQFLGFFLFWMPLPWSAWMYFAITHSLEMIIYVNSMTRHHRYLLKSFICFPPSMQTFW